MLLGVKRKWYCIGLELNLQVDTLENIQHEDSDDSKCLRKMLIIWLKQINPVPSWEALVSALKGQTVEEPQLAEQIRQKQCTTAGEKASLACKEYIFNRAVTINRFID